MKYLQPSFWMLLAPEAGRGGVIQRASGAALPKWLRKNSVLQTKLLDRAVSLVAPGGIIAYSTCSTFKEENEKVVASVMARHPELVEIPVDRIHKLMTKGKPFGTVIWPGLPWVDGFYLALLSKRK